MFQPPDFFHGAMPLTYVMIRILNARRVDAFRNAFTHFYNQFASSYVLDTYVLCLSEHNPADVDGVLSMWRGYGGNGDGAAIVLDSSKINNLPTSTFICQRCITPLGRIESAGLKLK
jgi:hypothetical protein